MTPQVLVVDDDPQILKLFVQILERGGYSVVPVSSGEYVMKTLQEVPIDVVVLDLSMPEPDGFDLLKQLRACMPGLRIVVVSGYLQGALLKAAELLGATATISKTDAPRRLLPTVREILQRFPPAQRSQSVK